MMGGYVNWRVIVILLVVALSIWEAYPLREKINLGLDLKGGTHLLLQVDMKKVPPEAQGDVADRVTEVIRNRIDEFGVREPTISREGKDKVVVQLPGVADRQRAIDIVSKTAHLEFKLVSDRPEGIKKAQEGTVPDGFEYKHLMGTASSGPVKLLVRKEAVLTGEHLVSASVGFDAYNQPLVQLRFDKEGAEIFDKVTARNIGRRLAIVLDGKVHSAPVIQDRIPEGKAQITGKFTVEEASDLALVLRAGSLPAPVKIMEERTVGPSLGRDSVEKGIKAAIIGGLFVFLFMSGYYFIPGLIADIGLIVYGIIMIGALAALRASLTLPGIAGFILSIGMAVDANVLVNERIREELEAGKTIRSAIEGGYHKAFSAIVDSNVTTLVTSVILFLFGTGPVKGFGVTLTIGIIASMFSALFVTRVIFEFLTRYARHFPLNMLRLIGRSRIPFLRGRFFAYGFSLLTLLIGLTAFIWRGHENFGVEFKGGTLVLARFQQPVEMSLLRGALDREDVQGGLIQLYGDPAQNQFIVKIPGTETRRVETALSQVSGPGQYEILRVDQIGPIVSENLRTKALWAFLLACAGILIYLTWRFEWKFAAAAVVALIHDTVFTFGVYALSGREINLPIIAAILTIIGYSVNDTIVTFDRVRDNLKLMRKQPFKKVVEVSINQVLGRTILTSFTTILTVAAVFAIGGSAINDFAFTLLVGFGVGVYSTIFVASSLLVDWAKH